GPVCPEGHLSRRVIDGGVNHLQVVKAVAHRGCPKQMDVSRRCVDGEHARAESGERQREAAEMSTEIEHRRGATREPAVDDVPNELPMRVADELHPGQPWDQDVPGILVM